MQKYMISISVHCLNGFYYFFDADNLNVLQSDVPLQN
jgi:hypothetical protein